MLTRHQLPQALRPHPTRRRELGCQRQMMRSRGQRRGWRIASMAALVRWRTRDNHLSHAGSRAATRERLVSRLELHRVRRTLRRRGSRPDLTRERRDSPSPPVIAMPAVARAKLDSVFVWWCATSRSSAAIRCLAIECTGAGSRPHRERSSAGRSLSTSIAILPRHRTGRSLMGDCAILAEALRAHAELLLVNRCR